MSFFVRPIKFMPVFVGTAESGEKIVVYQTLSDLSPEYAIKINNGELQALAGGEILMNFNPIESIMHFSLRSDVWTGNAIGTRKELLDEEEIR